MGADVPSPSVSAVQNPQPQPGGTGGRPLVLGEALVRRHQASVWRFLRFLGCPPDVADDLTQDTFVRLLRLPEPLAERGDAALAAWLRATAHNLFRMLCRRPRRGIELLSHDELERGFGAVCPTADGGDAYLDALAVCLERLDERSRDALRRRHAGNESREAIAVHLGLQADGVKTLLRRAREKLRQCIRTRLRRSGDGRDARDPEIPS